MLAPSYYDPERCLETVDVKDQYRRTGRGPGGFEMHYNEQQCSRKPQKEREYCWQHPWAKKRGVPMGEKGATS